MGKPDTLSQRADHPQGTNDNSNITLLTPEKFHIRASQIPTGALLSTPEQGFVDGVRQCRDLDDTVVRALKTILHPCETKSGPEMVTWSHSAGASRAPCK